MTILSITHTYCFHDNQPQHSRRFCCLLTAVPLFAVLVLSCTVSDWEGFVRSSYFFSSYSSLEQRRFRNLQVMGMQESSSSKDWDDQSLSSSMPPIPTTNMATILPSTASAVLNSPLDSPVLSAETGSGPVAADANTNEDEEEGGGAVAPVVASPAAPPPKVSSSATFYAVADAPYTPDEAIRLRKLMKTIPADADFVIHLGDIRSVDGSPPCTRTEYSDVAQILKQSSAPVFIVLGDNDWNDCPNPDEGLQFWKEEFLEFESRFWNHSFSIERQPAYPENFAFVWKQSLFVGLNMVGGTPPNLREWRDQLSSQASWTMDRIASYFNQTRMNQRRMTNHRRMTNSTTTAAAAVAPNVVIFAHADPGSDHDTFFRPLRRYLQNNLKDSVPVLYMNGDTHEWSYDPQFYGVESFLRIMLTAEALEPPLKVTIQQQQQQEEELASGLENATDALSPVNVFQYDRQL